MPRHLPKDRTAQRKAMRLYLKLIGDRQRFQEKFDLNPRTAERILYGQQDIKPSLALDIAVSCRVLGNDQLADMFVALSERANA